MEKIFSLGIAFALLLALVGCEPDQGGQPTDITTPTPIENGDVTDTADDIEDIDTQADETIDASVEIINNQFIPETLEVNVGDTVEWVNLDSTTHTITAFGIERDLLPGEGYTYTFDQVGTYNYESVTNPGMIGTIVVSDTATITTTSTDTTGTDTAGTTTEDTSGNTDTGTGTTGGY